MIDFQVEDELSGAPVNIVLYLKEGAGGVRLGDRVRVYGHMQRRTRTIRAYKVEIYETGGRPANYAVAGVHPWPLWVGGIILGSTLLLYVWLFLYYGAQI